MRDNFVFQIPATSHTRVVVRKPSGQIGDRLMRLLTTFTLLTICLTAIGQTSPTKKDSWFRVDTLFAKNGQQAKNTDLIILTGILTLKLSTLILPEKASLYKTAYQEVEGFTDSTGKSLDIEYSGLV